MARLVFQGPTPPQPPTVITGPSIGEGLASIAESLLERKERERAELVRQEQTRVSQLGLDIRANINPFQDFTPTGPRGRGDPSGAQSFVRGERGTQKDKFLSALRESKIQPTPELQPLIDQILEGLPGAPEVGPIVQLEPGKEAVRDVGGELVTVREAVPEAPITKPEFITVTEEIKDELREVFVLIDKVTGKEIARFDKGAKEFNIDVPEVKLALASIVDGQGLEGFTPLTRSIVEGKSREEAGKLLELQSGQFIRITKTGEDFEIQIGGAPKSLTERQAEAAARARGTASVAIKKESMLKLAEQTTTQILFSEQLRRINEAPEGAFGITAALGEFFGGLAGQARIPGFADLVTVAITGGASQDQLTQLRTGSRLIVAQSIEETTGEESGRIANEERRIAEKTVKALSLIANKQQAVTAVGLLLTLKLANMQRLMILSGSSKVIGLTRSLGTEEVLTDNDIREQFESFKDMGLSPKQAADAIKTIVRVRTQVSPIVGVFDGIDVRPFVEELRAGTGE